MFEDNFEEITLSEYIIKEIKKHNISIDLNEYWLNIFNIIEDSLENSLSIYYYSNFKEITVNDKKYYTINLEMEITDYYPYLIIDFDNKKVIREALGMRGAFTECYWDEYGNELILNGDYTNPDLNYSTLLEMLMSGITYITAQKIIDLRKEGKITKEKINNLIKSSNFSDTYFF